MTASPDILRVALAERSYDIQFGVGNRVELGSFLRERTVGDHILVIPDETVDGLYADALGDVLSDAEWDVDVLVVSAGEGSKSVETLEELWNAMLDAGADRQSVVVAVGGGVVGDLAGYAAASFARGIDFFQVPTTLLAQVDSSVGGKVGINLPGAKNMIGAFWQPRGVLVDVAVLETLPEREYRAGLAEVVKYGMILDADFFSTLENRVDAIERRDPVVLAEIVRWCCRLKADVVQADERETSGLRAVLNYGHTFGHAFEAMGRYEEMLHGEAVAAGMRCAARLALSMGRIEPSVWDRQEGLLRRLKLDIAPPVASPEELLRLMCRDKKAARGRLRFVLPSRLGHVELVGDVPDEKVLAALDLANG